MKLALALVLPIVVSVGLSSCKAIANTKKSVEIHAAVIRGDGQLVPVAKTEFSFVPYNLNDLMEKAAAKHNLGPMPPEGTPKYTEWAKKASKGLDEEVKLATKDRPSIKVVTDLEGKTKAEFLTGTWYGHGKYEFGRAHVFWSDAKFVIDKDTNKIEFSNTNGTVIND